MRRFETSIKSLLDTRDEFILKTGGSPVFLSDWDTSFQEIVLPSIIPSISIEEAHPYYYWTDEQKNKKSFIHYVSSHYGRTLDEEQIALATNGTASLFVAFMALKELNIKNVLVLTPAYFTTLNIMDYFDFRVRLFPIPIFNTHIDYEELQRIIKEERIEVIMLTNPLFGTGVEIEPRIISQLSQYANKYDLWVVMDYVYGGMSWEKDVNSSLIFNHPMLIAVSQAKKYVFIESISKRLLLNGVKFAFIISTEKMMRRILRLSVFSVGSMSSVQAKICNRIYSTENEKYLISIIKRNIKTAQQNYFIMKSIIHGTNIEMTIPNCGFFSLVSLPKPDKGLNDMQFAKNLIKQHGIMTVPHSRYLYQKKNYYSFRINLLIEQEKLASGINQITDLFGKQ